MKKESVCNAAPKGRNMNNPVQVQRSGTQLGDARCPALHLARRTDFPRCTGITPRERQGDALYPRATHGVIHRQPLRG